MCTLVILRRTGHDWPLLVAANRDEMAGRPWHPPARHWPDRDHVVAGRDELAGGTWLGMNDDRLVAAVLNRAGTLGPAEDKRSRGELPLEALDHAEARIAAEALGHLDARAYKSFNLVIADPLDAFWIAGDGETGVVRVTEIPEGVHLVTAHDMNDTQSPRIRRYLPRFRGVEPPDAETADWSAWTALLADTGPHRDGGEKDSMAIRTDYGFETVSSSLIALPDPARTGVRPRWLFCKGMPGTQPFEPVI